MLEAGFVRLRPIMMTSLATIAGVVPLAFGFGAGAENRGPLARSVIGGIFLSTLITLIVVPSFYVLLEKINHWLNLLSKGVKASPVLPPASNIKQSNQAALQPIEV
jgi:predicted RND superfamily exporter protein